MTSHLEDGGDVLGALVKWLVFEAAPTATAVELLQGFADRLCDAGFDLIRLNVEVRPLSPQAAAVLYVWRPVERSMELSPDFHVVDREQHALEDSRVQVVSLAHGAFQTEDFRASPFFPLTNRDRVEVRCRIAAEQTDFEFPILEDLKAQGATDYVALPIELYASAPSAISFATSKGGGFSEDDLDVLRAVRRPLQMALSSRMVAHTMHTLLGAYLGAKTADRVLAGTVQRGDVEEIDAAIWFSDLRGFTPLSASVSSSTLIAWLNDYFAAIGRAIARHDGEILKFIGDAILAVWPVSSTRSRRDTCRAALAAARGANLELDALNLVRQTSGLSPLQHGIGLHVGSAQYGNIGAEGRLDFTVIGPAVNTASRLEGACATLSRRVVASAEFAECVEGLVALGVMNLKGVSGARAVFGIDE